jgi:hypothetical protein
MNKPAAAAAPSLVREPLPLPPLLLLSWLLQRVNNDLDRGDRCLHYTYLIILLLKTQWDLKTF